MGCFLGCFGSSKDCKGSKQIHKVQPQDQRSVVFTTDPPSAALPHDYSAREKENTLTVTPDLQVPDKVTEKSSPSNRKRVTFNSNVETYVHEQVADFSLKNEEHDKQQEDSSQSRSSENSSSTSSSGCYPPNHRYQNCRDSDDELDYDSDIEDQDDDSDEDDDDMGLEEEYDDIDEESAFDESDKSTTIYDFPEEDVKPIESNLNARDRSNYHQVLNPVENLTQWRSMKSRVTTTTLKKLKENSAMDGEPREFLFSFKEKSDESRNPKQELAVDASLSTWLSSSENTPSTKPSTNLKHGSASPTSFEDRPILGALTVEELKQMSVSSSPRKSPSQSPDDMAIIGTVGSYWNHTSVVKDLGSASSYKGIPNTTSKYREDKRVNWHSTPFETRLERVLNKGVADAYCLQNFE